MFGSPALDRFALNGPKCYIFPVILSKNVRQDLKRTNVQGRELHMMTNRYQGPFLLVVRKLQVRSPIISV